jgi:hypothetical protein
MKIKIGGVSINASPYDDNNTLLQKYSLAVDGTKPSFFRLTSPVSDLKEGSKLKIEDVRDILRNVKLSNLVAVASDLADSFPSLSKKDIGMLWLFSSGPPSKTATVPPADIETLSQLDSHSFRGAGRLADLYESYKREIEIFRGSLEKQNAQLEKYFTRLESKPAVEADEFISTDIFTRVTLSLPGGENLLDIFDAMDVSVYIPFVHVIYRGQHYYKIYKHIELPRVWLEPETDEHLPKLVDMSVSEITEKGYPDGIYFKILNAPIAKLSSKQDLLANLFATAVLAPKSKLEFSQRKLGPEFRSAEIPKLTTESASRRYTIDVRYKFQVGEDEKKITATITSSFETRLKYVVDQQRQTGIGGTFEITAFAFNRYIFADLMLSDTTINYFLFANESASTVLEKLRFYIYYGPGHATGTSGDGSDITKSLALLITPHPPTSQADPGTTTIRISHAVDLAQANITRSVLLKLFSIYSEKLDAVTAEYSKIIPNFKKLTAPEVKETKKDQKTGARAKALAKEDKSLFRSRYPDSCQKEKQPQVISEEDAEALLNTFNGPAEENGRAMFFKGKWYGCDPRDEDEDSTYIWPGLQVNKTDKDAKYLKEEPLLPCCFAVNQMTKESSALYKYRQNQDVVEEEKAAAKVKLGTIGYVKGPAKALPSDRYGMLPYNWTRMLNVFDVPLKKIGTQNIHPILRHSVLQTVDSFFHCLERVFNPSYLYANTETRKRMVTDVRTTIAGWKDFGIAKQELYDYSDESIREMLLDPSYYLAPEEFISLAKKYYKTNIFIYVWDPQDNVDGDIVLPRHSQAYLGKKFDESLPTVVIIKYAVGARDYPYQCEVVCELKGKNEIDFDFPAKHVVVEISRTIFDAANVVYVLSSTGAEPYQV